VLPASSGGGALDVAGLSAAERTRRGLAEAGIAHVTTGIPATEGHTLFVAGDAVIEPEALLALMKDASAGMGSISAENPIEAPAALLVPAGASDALVEAEDLGLLAGRLRENGRLRLTVTGDMLCQRVQTAPDAERVTRRLLASLVRPSDGFFARHFDRRISSWLSPRMLRRGLSPNAITILATAVGLAGASLLATQSYWLVVAGALLFIASTILDGCDGEVARLSFASSELGRRLDLICDNVVNAAVFVAIGWSATQAPDGGVTRFLVFLTLGGFVLATFAGFFFSRWIERTGRGAQFDAWYESLASRDFAYFVLLLALLGRLHWFVWFAAVGSYAFVAALTVIRLRAGRRPSPPTPPVSEQQWA
jgi:phosphatidylglycerophosphate synthase